MGQAKRRGTYEQRKAEAIEAGRVKRESQPRRQAYAGPDDFAMITAMSMIPLMMRAGMNRRRK